MTVALKQVNSTLAEEALERMEAKFFSLAAQDALTKSQVKEAFEAHDEAEAMNKYLDRLPVEMHNRAALVVAGFRLLVKKFRRP